MQGCCGQKVERLYGRLYWFRQELTNLQILFLYIIWSLASEVSHLISRSADYIWGRITFENISQDKIYFNFLNTRIFNWNVYVSSAFWSLCESFTPFSLSFFFSIAFHGYCSNKGIQIIDSTLQFFLMIFKL